VVPQWERLSAGGASSIYTSPAWCLAAWRHFPRLGSPFLLTVMDEDGRLTGLLPLTKNERGLFCAGSPLGDEHDLRTGHSPQGRQAISVLVDELKRQHQDGVPVLLSDLRPGGILARNAPTRPGCPAPILQLRDPDCESGRLARLPGWSRKRLKSLQRAHRRLAELGPVTLILERDPETLRSLLPVFVKTRLAAWQHRDRLDELPEMDRHPCLPAFIKDVGQTLAKKNRCFLAQLLVNEHPVAQALYFQTDRTALLYMTTYEPEAAKYSPSHLLFSAVAGEATREGFRVIELGRGDEAYKFDLGAQPRYLRELTL
jgi:CelD/BcsL family acetyltransferase involved in cellulose biosynthesis